jgi:hypothetical protein
MLRDSLGDIWHDHLPLLSCLQTEERLLIRWQTDVMLLTE